MAWVHQADLERCAELVRVHYFFEESRISDPICEVLLDCSVMVKHVHGVDALVSPIVDQLVSFLVERLLEDLGGMPEVMDELVML